jgi:hypothetical protein
MMLRRVERLGAEAGWNHLLGVVLKALRNSNIVDRTSSKYIFDTTAKVILFLWIRTQ